MPKKTTRDLGDSPGASDQYLAPLTYGVNHLLAIAIDDYDTIRNPYNGHKAGEDLTDTLPTN